jgi:DNA polymerase III alpha subunit
MVFVTLEDGSGLINLAITPSFYPKWHHALDSESLLCVCGMLQRQHTAHSLLVQKVFTRQVRTAAVVPFGAYQRSDQGGLVVWDVTMDQSGRTRSYM